MNHTTAIERPSTPDTRIAQPDPAEVLFSIIVALLAPMFILAGNGDINCARDAARQTVMAYRAQSDAEMIAVVQIIAFGLAALSSLSRSMEDDLSLNMTLRLRANANACNRGAEHNRRALKELRADSATPYHTGPTAPPEEAFNEDALIASVTQALEKTGQNQPPKPAIPPSAPAPTAPRPTFATPTIPTPPQSAQIQSAQIQSAQIQSAQIQSAQIQSAHTQAAHTQAAQIQSERQIQIAWAAGMARAAAKYTADLDNLSPLERRQATIRATALSSCAHDLLAGNAGARPRPGDLAAVMRPIKR